MAAFIVAPLKQLIGDKLVVVAADEFYIFKVDIAQTHNACFETQEKKTGSNYVYKLPNNSRKDIAAMLV